MGKDYIMEKKIERGILQGDSLSPLLFVLCMDPLSRQLSGLYPKVSVKTDKGYNTSNHLLFIDDLKLLAEKDDVLVAMLEETKRFFKTIGLEMNKDKSATNTSSCSEDAQLLEGKESYKYLGITESSTSEVTPESLNKIRTEILKRTRELCKTRLNAKNLFKAINEHAISLINYHIGVLKLGPDDFAMIDQLIRQTLVDSKIHMQPGCKERLYLPRDQMGRGLQNVEHRSENMLLQLRNSLELSKETSSRRAAILKVENEFKTHLSLISSFLATKYSIKEEVTLKNLMEAQINALKSEINSKKSHEKLFRACNNELVSVKDSSIWLKNGNNSARDEAAFCYIQDRNIFWGEKALCPHCKNSLKTVDHLATKCDRMLGHDYMRRHNEVVKCIYLLMCNKYGFKNEKKT